MPIVACTRDGRPGFKACSTCACFTYAPGNEAARARARARAARQLRAVKARQATRRRR